MKAKKLFILVVGLSIIMSSLIASGQRVSKMAKKESKHLTRSGYYVVPGALPIRKQLERAYTMENEYDSIGFPKFFITSGIAIAQNQSSAMAHATAVAKVSLANMVKSNIAGIIETSLSNNQLTNDEAKSISKVVSAYTDLIAQELGRIIPVVVLYRKVGDNYEANVRIAYNAPMAMKAAKDVLLSKLEEETNVAREKLEKLMNINNK